MDCGAQGGEELLAHLETLGRIVERRARVGQNAAEGAALGARVTRGATGRTTAGDEKKNEALLDFA